jgi:hypothetical protein
MTPTKGPLEFRPPEQLTFLELKDAIQQMGGQVEQNTEDGNWYLYWQDKVVLLDARSEEAAVRAAFKWLLSPA